MNPLLERVAEQLRSTPTEETAVGNVESHSAVAMLLRDRNRGVEVLLLKRAEREGDRWSGHISLPGGREEEVDESLLATAIRETEEETGVSLERTAELLGPMPPIQASARGELLPMGITPFVFREVEPSPIRLNEEAVESFWFPLERAAAGELSASFLKQYGEKTHELPCWDFEGYRVWGLTFMMLGRLLELGGF